jgi:hypothetical protein
MANIGFFILINKDFFKRVLPIGMHTSIETSKQKGISNAFEIPFSQYR